MKLPALLRAMRPQQWVKNIFVLAAVIFARADVTQAHDTHDWSDVYSSLFAFAAFCLGASGIYLINDVLDRESDRAHPTKSLRPIASGELSVPAALAASVACIGGALGLAWITRDGERVVMVVASYIALNAAYSLKLKQMVLVDAFCIAAGFLLRVKAGALAAHADVSHWLMLCTLFLSLFLALCKRRAEIDLLGEDRGSHRANLRHYTPQFLDQMVTMLAGCTVLCYTMYTVSEETTRKFGSHALAAGSSTLPPHSDLIYTVPFVVFGLGRYLLLVSQQRGGGNPTRMLLGGDAIFVLNAVAWATVTAFVVYGRL